MGATVATQTIAIMDTSGRRLKEPRRGELRYWKRHKNVEANLRAAIKYTEAFVKKYHRGVVVLLITGADKMPVYQGKWGTNNKPFFGWKPNPVAEYWRKRV